MDNQNINETGIPDPMREIDEETHHEFERLVEKHGEKTVTVEDHEGREQEVTGADCPECEGGVILVSPDYEGYPPFNKYCTECGDL